MDTCLIAVTGDTREDYLKVAKDLAGILKCAYLSCNSIKKYEEIMDAAKDNLENQVTTIISTPTVANVSQLIDYVRNQGTSYAKYKLVWVVTEPEFQLPSESNEVMIFDNTSGAEGSYNDRLIDVFAWVRGSR